MGSFLPGVQILPFLCNNFSIKGETFNLLFIENGTSFNINSSYLVHFSVSKLWVKRSQNLLGASALLILKDCGYQLKWKISVLRDNCKLRNISKLSDSHKATKFCVMLWPRSEIRMNETYKPLTVLTFDFTKLYLATMLIKSSTVQNGVSIKSPQITHFALTFSYSFIYQNFWKTINNGVLLINNGTAVLSRLRQAYQRAVTNPSTRSPLRHSSAERRSACH